MTVVDDYAHHPDEITATLDSAKHFPHNRTWCVFQPHTYSRTKALLGDFAKALSLPTLSSSPTYMLQEKLITLE